MCRVVEGEFKGALVTLWLRFPEKPRQRRGGRLRPMGRRAKIRQIFDRLIGGPPPDELYTLDPTRLLGDCIFSATLRTVRKDATGRARVPDACYSVVGEVLGIVAGAPPLLREKFARRSNDARTEVAKASIPAPISKNTKP
jgi:hypothetical protein